MKSKCGDPEDIEASGDMESSDWFFKVEKAWNDNRTARNRSVSFQKNINHMNKITLQNLNKKYVVLYTSSGKNTVSSVIERTEDGLKFVAENISYQYATSNKDEAYYLCAILNSSVPNDIIKPFQALGLMGERHIHTKILQIPFPRYDAGDSLHVKLARLAQTASDKVSGFVAERNFGQRGGNMNPGQLGRFRNEVRALVGEELGEIDRVLGTILSV